ncbi:MAG: L-threonylcarbamoyladenylate synthase, partial [Firmicutes bacterium]|nr:L-threonylcarbamoyladenylate synthase [Bacillota bacterium]
PGPLSLVLPRSAGLPSQVSAGRPTVAVRMPAHPVALSLIRAAGVPLAAPSANRSGRPSPTEARHVLEELAGRIEAVLDGGACTVGVESTVLDLSGTRPVILRPGAVTGEQLERVLGKKICGKAGFWPAGQPFHQYRPRVPLILITGPRSRRRPLLAALTAGYRRKGFRVGLLLLPGGARQSARDLFPALRRFDHRKVDLILAEGCSPRGLGGTVLNRLAQAASRIIKA